ncbi:hypothetical protein [uncultured Ruegeria sp.]|uniref:hypothetical protein n=1 Tax=uncultured Ruegeria sp. TaxID=259304 RepID=UPI002638DB19|nr:hypothetical protein [uncultured Ruegeria sp.]
MQKYLSLSYIGSLSALGVATCCILPMTMMLMGIGGSWMAIFGQIAAASFYVLAISTALVMVSWLMSYQRGSLPKLKWWLLGTTAMTGLAWIVVFYEARINDFLIMQM